jgi:hypothetical protein
MRTLLVFLAAALFCPRALADTAPAAPTATAAPGPRLLFEAKEIDFGKVLAGSKVERIFKLRNAGDRDLVIRRIKPSCGCTAALLSQEVLPPGAAGEIRVSFDSGERLGFQEVQVHVFSNDPREQDLGENVSILKLRGEVANLLQVMPGSAYFPSFLRGTKQERRITVLPVDESSVGVLSIETTKPYVLVETRPFERTRRRGFELLISIAPEAPLGRLDERVIVTTDHPQQKQLRIAVFGTIHGEIAVFPERLQLFAADLAEQEPSIFVQRIAGEAAGPLPIEAVETPPWMTAETQEIVPEKRVEIRLRIKPDAPRGAFATTIRIFLRDPKQPLFEVPVVGEVPRRVKVDPPALWIEAPAAGGAGPAANGGEPLPVSIVRVTGGAVKEALVSRAPFKARLVPGALPPRAVQLIVARAEDAAAGPFSGTLVIRTDVPGEETVEIPLRGILR